MSAVGGRLDLVVAEELVRNRDAPAYVPGLRCGCAAGVPQALRHRACRGRRCQTRVARRGGNGAERHNGKRPFSQGSVDETSVQGRRQQPTLPHHTPTAKRPLTLAVDASTKRSRVIVARCESTLPTSPVVEQEIFSASEQAAVDELVSNDGGKHRVDGRGSSAPPRLCLQY